MKLLSLDISSTCTGYTKLEVDNGVRHIETSHIKPKGKDIYSRMVQIDAIMRERGLYSWADLCIVEGYAYGGKALAALAEMNGIIKFNLTLNEVPFDNIAPTTVKKQITGNGRAKKEEVREALSKFPIFEGYEFQNEDESDSAAVGLSYLMREGIWKN